MQPKHFPPSKPTSTSRRELHLHSVSCGELMGSMPVATGCAAAVLPSVGRKRVASIIATLALLDTEPLKRNTQICHAACGNTHPTFERAISTRRQGVTSGIAAQNQKPLHGCLLHLRSLSMAGICQHCQRQAAPRTVCLVSSAVGDQKRS